MIIMYSKLFGGQGRADTLSIFLSLERGTYIQCNLISAAVGLTQVKYTLYFVTLSVVQFVLPK